MNDKTIEYELRYIQDFVKEINVDPYNHEYLNLYCFENNIKDISCELVIKLTLNGTTIARSSKMFLNRTLITTEDKRSLCKEFRTRFFRLIFENTLLERIQFTKILENE